MLSSLLHEIRIRPVIWRRRLTLYWRIDAREHLPFLAMISAPLLVLGAIVYLAYLNQQSIDAARLAAEYDAAQRRAIDLHCLAENVYFEARGEPLQGQYAVAEVTMNRLASRYFPNTLCEVVHDTRWDSLRRRLTAHFSWTALEISKKPMGPAWDQALEVAAAVYDGNYTPVMPADALFYHATYVRPYWAKRERVIARIGNHVFYR